MLRQKRGHEVARANEVNRIIRFMQILEELRARGVNGSRGLTMLLVVIVLSTLLVVGVLFAAAASLDVRASAYYRQAAQAELFALEGLYRAMAELYYDVWGVDEDVAFVCADADDPETETRVEGELKDAAYACPGTGKVLRPRSRWRRSVSPVTADGETKRVLTDFRWMVEEADARGTMAVRAPGRVAPATHSGAPYHDEFLPEFTDNSDAWELGLHLNSGGAFGRSWGRDACATGGVWSLEWEEDWPGLYWVRHRPRREFDYVDTRIVGDSFYKIFRFELIDPVTGESRAAGLDPATGAYVDASSTHIGDATEGSYLDTRGGAININQVNNNYQWELYWGGGETVEEIQMYHYNESKWIYVYNTRGDHKLGRYAVLVWPDCGYPNANMQYDVTEVASVGERYSLSSTASYLMALDWGFSPHGGPLGLADNIVSERVKGYERVVDSNGKELPSWCYGLGARIGEYKDEHGLISSRAEMNMFIRKGCYTRGANDGVPGWSEKEAALDAHIISALVTVNGYEYLLDHHWANDRLVLDKLGLPGELMATLPRTRPVPSSTSLFANAQTRRRYSRILDELRYTSGPDDAHEGAYTQYHGGSYAKAVPLSWLAHMWFRVRDDYQVQAGRPYGVRLTGDGTGITWKSRVKLRDVLDDRSLVVCRTDFPQISEIGTFVFPGADPDGGVRGGPAPWGWLDRYRPDGEKFEDIDGDEDVDEDDISDPLQKAKVYFDGRTPKYFIELVKTWETEYVHTLCRLDKKYHLYVNGYDVLNNSGETGDAYCKTTRVIGIDEESEIRRGSSYYLKCEDDWSPKVVPNESDYGSGWPSNVAGQRVGDESGRGNNRMVLVSFNNYRGGRGNESPWPESWSRAHPGNYLVITFDGAAEDPEDPCYNQRMRDAVKPVDGETSIVLTWGRDGDWGEDYVLDAVFIPAERHKNHASAFDCGFEAYDPVNNQLGELWASSGGDPNLMSPAWRDVSGRRGEDPDGNPSRPGFRDYWHNRETKVGKFAGETGRWLDGLNYHTVLAYLPGGERAPADGLGYSLSDVRDRSGAVSNVACGSNMVGGCWGGDGGARDWEGLVKAPTGFLPEGGTPDPFLRWWADLMKVTPLERVVTAGYLGNYRDDISAFGEHVIFDEVDNDMDGHIDDFSATHIAGDHSKNGHYLADRKVTGRMNINEMQHPAAIWYGGFCNGKFASQTVFVGRKPLKGYTSWVECLTRGVFCAQPGHRDPVEEPYDMIFWHENQFGDCSSDHTHRGRMIEASVWSYKDTSRVLFAGNSPVYTVYVTGQVLRENRDPVAERKLRATVERTWDGKMNVLEFCWIPREPAADE